MQNAIQVFESQEFGQLGVLMIDGKPHFPATECAKTLGYNQPEHAIKRHCKGCTFHTPLTAGGVQQKKYILEGDLYRLIIRSKLPAAERFEAWVFDEVLPSIRKYGAYIDEDILLRMQENSEYNTELLKNLSAEKRRNSALVNKLAVIAPKAHYHDIILHSLDAIPITLIAKDYGMSAFALNKLLHSMKIQHKIGGVWVLYKEHHNFGYTTTHTYTKNGLTSWMHTCWTQRGRFWLYELLKARGILPVNEQTDNGGQMNIDDMRA